MQLNETAMETAMAYAMANAERAARQSHAAREGSITSPEILRTALASPQNPSRTTAPSETKKRGRAPRQECDDATLIEWIRSNADLEVLAALFDLKPQSFLNRMRKSQAVWAVWRELHPATTRSEAQETNEAPGDAAIDLLSTTQSAQSATDDADSAATPPCSNEVLIELIRFGGRLEDLARMERMSPGAFLRRMKASPPVWRAWTQLHPPTDLRKGPWSAERKAKAAQARAARRAPVRVQAQTQDHAPSRDAFVSPAQARDAFASVVQALAAPDTPPQREHSTAPREGGFTVDTPGFGRIVVRLPDGRASALDLRMAAAALEAMAIEVEKEKEKEKEKEQAKPGHAQASEGTSPC